MTDLRKAAEMVAYEVPLHELLEGVPEDARLVIDSENGMSTRYIPVGRLCKRAAEALRQALAQPEQEPVDMVKIEHDKQVELAQAYERGWNAALAHEQEPVAWMSDHDVDFKKSSFGTYPCVPLYTAPPSLEAAVSAEREACAKVCDERERPNLYGVKECAKEIRARSEK